jgi:hypothetical protein
MPFAYALPFGYVPRLAFLIYGWLALNAFIGVVLFEHREAIGFEPSRSPERLAERERREHDRELDLLVDRIFAQWRGGAHGNAWSTVDAHLRNSADRLAELRALFERIARWPDPRLGNLLAQELVSGLLAAHRTGDALTVVRERLRVDATFRPLRASDTLRMAELARDAGERLTARQLLADFSSRFPDDPAQSLAARLSADLVR